MVIVEKLMWRKGVWSGSWLIMGVVVSIIAMALSGCQAGGSIEGYAGGIETPVEEGDDGGGGVVDVDSPTVSSTSPIDGATGVAVNASIEFTLSESMDPSSIVVDNFKVYAGSLSGNTAGPKVEPALSSDPIECAVSYLLATRTAQCTPQSVLEPYSTYTAILYAAASDMYGNPMSEDYIISFTTGDPLPVAPSVSETTPVGDATGIDHDSSISVTFDGDIDESTLDSSSFQVSSEFGAVSGSIGYDEGSRTATFTPTRSLIGYATVSVTLTTDIISTQGLALAATHNFTFDTAHAPAVDVDGGEYHSMALKEDGTVWTWGENDFGVLGVGQDEGELVESHTPVRVANLSDIIAIAAGNYHCLAIKSDGTVWAWGYGSLGQLGDGAGADSTVPVQVSGITDATMIAAGEDHSMAVKDDGTLWVWGWNTNNAFGWTSITNSTTPVQVAESGALTNVTSVAAGFETEGFSLAVAGDEVWAWGKNGSYGYLGDNQACGVGNCATPTNGANGWLPSTPVIVGAGWLNSYAILDDGSVWSWGDGSYGQLCEGAWSTRRYPVAADMTNIGTATVLDGGDEYVLIINTDGEVWGCGANWDGQLGDPASYTDESTVPVQVTQASGMPAIEKIAAAWWHSLAVDNEGRVWAWGYNGDGELGDGTTTESVQPVLVVWPE